MPAPRSFSRQGTAEPIHVLIFSGQDLRAPFLPFAVADDRDPAEAVIVLHVELEVAPDTVEIPPGKIRRGHDYHRNPPRLPRSELLEPGHEIHTARVITGDR